MCITYIVLYFAVFSIPTLALTFVCIYLYVFSAVGTRHTGEKSGRRDNFQRITKNKVSDRQHKTENDNYSCC